jgi:hypothetical protein
MKWITREKIKVDRVACPWLIRNFVDSETEFVFLTRETEWEKIDNRTVFDVPNYELGHHGEDVSFNSILKKYNLTEPALVLLEEIVRAADSRPTTPHPAAPRGRRFALDRKRVRDSWTIRLRNSRA